MCLQRWLAGLYLCVITEEAQETKPRLIKSTLPGTPPGRSSLFGLGGAPTVWHGEWRLETQPTQTLLLRFHCLGPRATDGTERMLTTTFLHGVDVANIEYRGYDYRGRPVHVQRHSVYQISADGQYEEMQP